MGNGGIAHPMTSLNELLQQGASNIWLFIPSAILLGALHGLEPGHSKTMMAAFIVAIRGTIGQAILLGLCATISHTLIIWALAGVGLHFGNQWNAETTEPYFQLASGAIIIGIAIWMFIRTRRDIRMAAAHRHMTENKGPKGGIIIDTGHGLVEITVFETNVPPCFRLFFYTQMQRPRNPPDHDELTIETKRLDGKTQVFQFVRKEDFLESISEIPEPHEFQVKLNIGHSDHVHTYQTEFIEEDHHHHHAHHGEESLEYVKVEKEEFQDAHERAHANELYKRFSNQTVTNWQIILFGLTGGLMPCPAALTVLLICLHLKKVVLGLR
jgi:nickel/cobalt transporter (NicO) family protein